MKNNKPVIRFKGFSEEWEEKELGNEVDFFSGLTYSPTNIVKVGGTLVLRSSNVKNGEIVYDDNVYVNSNVVNSENVKVGDIVVVVRNGSRSLIGKHAQIKQSLENTVIGAFMTGIHCQQPTFINALLDTVQYNKEIEKNLGATINQITTGAFKKMIFKFPQSIEQTQIGNFFKNLDNLITLHQRKYEKLGTLKKAMLEKMFPKNGANVPEIRFKGFEGAWEEKTLGRIIDLRSGRDYKHLSNGNIPVYGTGGYMLSVNEALSYNEDAIGIGRKGTIDKPYKLQAPFWTVDTLFYAVPLEENNLDFIYAVFQRIDWKQRNEATGVPSLSKVAINGIQVSIPKREEQEKIGIYFKNLDDLLKLHEGELAKLKNLKKALLEKMFV